MENNFIEMEWSRLWWLLSVVVTEYVLVLAAVGADMASGISKSRKRGEATRSRSLRRTVDKLARYYNVLVVLTVVDAMQIAGAWFMRAVEGYAVPTVPLFTLCFSRFLRIYMNLINSKDRRNSGACWFPMRKFRRCL